MIQNIVLCLAIWRTSAAANLPDACVGTSTSPDCSRKSRYRPAAVTSLLQVDRRVDSVVNPARTVEPELDPNAVYGSAADEEAWPIEVLQTLKYGDVFGDSNGVNVANASAEPSSVTPASNAPEWTVSPPVDTAFGEDVVSMLSSASMQTASEAIETSPKRNMALEEFEEHLRAIDRLTAGVHHKNVHHGDGFAHGGSLLQETNEPLRSGGQRLQSTDVLLEESQRLRDELVKHTNELEEESRRVRDEIANDMKELEAVAAKLQMVHQAQPSLMEWLSGVGQQLQHKVFNSTI